MALTEFGRAVRKARLDANVSLGQMAEALESTASFLSAVEMGRKKVPTDLAEKTEQFFLLKGVSVKLGHLADIANKQVSLEGLAEDRQMMVACLARRNFSADELRKIAQLIHFREGTNGI